MAVGLVLAAAGALFATSAGTAAGTDLRALDTDLPGLVRQESDRLDARNADVAALRAEVDDLTAQVGDSTTRDLQATAAELAGSRPAAAGQGSGRAGHPRRRPVRPTDPGRLRPERRGGAPAGRPGRGQRAVGQRRRVDDADGPAGGLHQRGPLRRQRPCTCRAASTPRPTSSPRSATPTTCSTASTTRRRSQSTATSSAPSASATASTSRGDVEMPAYDGSIEMQHARPRQRRRRSQGWRVSGAGRAVRTATGALGELLITVGVLLLLFVAWQLWWTDVVPTRAQEQRTDALQQEWGDLAPDDLPPDPEVPADVGDPPALSAPDAGEAFAIVHVPRFGDGYQPRPVLEGTSQTCSRTASATTTETALPGARRQLRGRRPPGHLRQAVQPGRRAGRGRRRRARDRRRLVHLPRHLERDRRPAGRRGHRARCPATRGRPHRADDDADHLPPDVLGARALRGARRARRLAATLGRAAGVVAEVPTGGAG